MIYTATQLRAVSQNHRALWVMRQMVEAAERGETSVRLELGMKPVVGQAVRTRLEALGYTVTVHGQREDELEGTLYDVEISW